MVNKTHNVLYKQKNPPLLFYQQSEWSVAMLILDQDYYDNAGTTPTLGYQTQHNTQHTCRSCSTM